MEFIKVKTRTFKPPKDDIYDLLDEYLPELKEKDIVLIASKVVAIHQGRCIPVADIEKDDLVIQESDKYIPRDKSPSNVLLTLKNHTLIATSGIDESNADEHYILWPIDSDKMAKEICLYLRKKYALKKLAVIITDSHCIPCRRGVTGVSLDFFGLNPLQDFRGKKDIFARKLGMSQANVADSLAAAGVVHMGEADERTPLLIIREADFVEFSDKYSFKDLVIDEDEDIFGPLFTVFTEKS